MTAERSSGGTEGPVARGKCAGPLPGGHEQPGLLQLQGPRHPRRPLRPLVPIFTGMLLPAAARATCMTPQLTQCRACRGPLASIVVRPSSTRIACQNAHFQLVLWTSHDLWRTSDTLLRFSGATEEGAWLSLGAASGDLAVKLVLLPG